MIYPEISVIIPTKNEEIHIEKCLRSVLSQNYSKDKIEIIVVDNASTDSTLSIVKQFPTVKLIEKSSGTIASVRNFGVKHSKNPIIAFLDGDSVADPQWLKEGVEILNSQDVSMVGFAITPPGKNSTWVERTWYEIGSGSRYHGKGMCEVKWLSSFNLIVKRDYFEQVKGFNEFLKTSEDFDLGHRLSRISTLIFSEKVTVEHLDNAKTLSGLFFRELWRGKNDVITWWSNDKKLRGFPKIIVPVVFLLLNLLTPIVAFWSWNYAVVLFLTLMIFPLIMLLKKIRLKKISLFPQIFCLCYVYLLSRGICNVFLVWK